MVTPKRPLALILFTVLLAVGGALLLWSGVGPRPAQASASILYVSAVSGDDAGSCTSTAPCRTIQRAVSQAVDGDEIGIATLENLTTAIYTGSDSLAVVVVTKSLTLRGGYVFIHSELPPLHMWVPGFLPAQVDGEQARRALYVSGKISVTVEMLALTNGHAERGGNVYAEGVTLRFVYTPVLNGTASYGGGIYLKDCQTSIDPGDLSGLLQVQDNAAAYGGGIYVEGGTPALTALAVYSNTASSDGGGLYLQGGGPVVAAGIVQGNQAGGRGGGLFLEDSAARVAATAVLSNTAAQAGGGLYLDGPLTINPLEIPILANNYVRNNRAPEGAGLYLRLAIAGLINDVIADNHASGHGGGLFLYGSSPQGLHNTVAQNEGEDGLYLTQRPGSLWPPVLPIPSLPAFTNTVVVSHAVGVYVETTELFPPIENKATLRGTLWSGNWSGDTAGPGDVDLGSTNVYSAPLFTCVGNAPACTDPYHLQDNSPAVDAGVTPALTLPGTDLLFDIDGQLRPSGQGFDIGVDEVQQPGGVWLLPLLSLLTAEPGQTVTHTHTLLNTGTESDSYDLSLSGSRGWSALVTTSPITLAAQASTTVAVRVTVPAGATAGMTETVLLTAASRTSVSQAWALEETTVISAAGWADLSLDKRAGAAGIRAGEAVRFTLTMTNAGPFSGTVAVTLTDTAVPTAAIAAILAPPGCTADAASGQVTCTLDLPAGTPPVVTSLDLVITTTGTYTGVLLNGASVAGDIFDPNPVNNLAQAVVLVAQPGPQVVVTPEQVAITLTAGMTATRGLTIANEGESDLDWTLAEVLPAPWLSETPLSGTVAPGASTPVALYFDTAGLAVGSYFTSLAVSSNDPLQPLVAVPVALTVVPPCQPVTGTVLAWQPLTPTAGQSVTLTATATGTAPLAFAWTFGDDTDGSGATVTHTYAAGGFYQVVLTASNGCGQQVVTDTVLVCGPVWGTSFAWQPAFPIAGQPLTFTAAAGGTGAILFTWDLGDGATAAGEVLTHTYAYTGTYAVVLTATNACGQERVQRPVVVWPAGVVVHTIYLPLIWNEPAIP